MRALIEIELELDEPSIDLGFVTWFAIRVAADLPDGTTDAIGHARAARVHVGQVVDAGVPLVDVLDADSGELAALHGVFFDDEGVRETYRQGAGSDLLYVARVSIEAAWQGRGIELAVVRRVCDSLGEGCELAVVEYESAAEAAEWQRMGFQVTAPGAPAGYLHMPLAQRQARIVQTEDCSAFKVVPNPPPGREPHH